MQRYLAAAKERRGHGRVLPSRRWDPSDPRQARGRTTPPSAPTAAPLIADASGRICFPIGALSRLSADGGAFCTAEDRLGLIPQLSAVLAQRAIFPAQLVACILAHPSAALLKLLTL